MYKKFSKCMKKIIAAALVITLVGGLTFTGTVSEVIPASVTVNAASDKTDLVYDLTEDGTLTILDGTYNNPNLDVSNAQYPIKKIIAQDNVVLTGSCRSLFYYQSNIEEIDISNADTSGVTDMAYMFYNLQDLKTVKLGSFNTSNVTDMSQMFGYSSHLTSVTFGNETDTSSVTDMSYMFCMCYDLSSVDFGEKFSTSSVTNMSYMFSDCSNLTALDLSSFTNNNVTDMSRMFQNCYNLKDLNLSGFAVPYNKSTMLNNMFQNCYSIDYLDLSGFEYTYNTSNMFSGCSVSKIKKNSKFSIYERAYLVNKGISQDKKTEFQGWYEENDPDTIVSGDNSNASISSDKSGTFVLKKVSTDVDYAVSNDTITLKCGTFNEGDIGRILNYEIKFNSNITKLVVESSAVKFVNRADLDSNSYDGFMKGCDNLVYADVSNADISGASSLRNMFSNCYNLETVVFGDLDASAITDMKNMFSSCYKLKNVDLSSLDTSSVQDMHYMFYYCNNLESVTFGGKFVTAAVKDFSYMFCNCDKLKSLDLSSFDTSSATNMNGMFQSCDVLESVAFGDKFNTSSVEDFSGMFEGCTALDSIDTSNFDTSSATSFNRMFSNCTSLKKLDLSKFDSTKAYAESPEEYADDFFSNVPLEELILSDKFVINEDCCLYNFDINEEASVEVIGWTKKNSDEIVSGAGNYAVISGAGEYKTKTAELKWKYEFNNDRTLTLISGVYNSEILEKVESAAESHSGELTDEGGYPVRFEKPYYPFVGNMVVEDGVVLTGDCSGFFDISWNSYSSLTFKGHISTEHLTNMKNMFGVSHSAVTISGLDLKDFDTSEVTDMSEAFKGCSLEELDLSTFDTSNVTDMTSMFSEARAKKVIFGDKFDTSKVYSMSSMFKGCSNLESLDLSNFDTSAVGVVPDGQYVDYNNNGMISMFSGCSSLETLKLGSKFNTENVSYMDYMFKGCCKLGSIDISSFNTKKAVSMKDMFKDCSSASEIIPGDNFSIESVTGSNLEGMFSGCSSLRAIDLSNFKNSGGEYDNKVDSIREMFKDCSSLTKIDLSAMDMSGIYDVNSAFSGCVSLQEISLPEVSISDGEWSSGNLFENCGKLVKLKVPANVSFKEVHKLENANVVYTGWHKTGSDEIVSGTETYAVFTAQGDENENFITYERDYKDIVNTVINGASLTLKGQIGLNFYAVFPEEILKDADAYVVLNGPTGEQKLKISEAIFDRKSGYRFTYKLAAKETGDSVSFNVYNGKDEKQDLYKNNGEEIVSIEQNNFSYSIKDYINTVINSSDPDSNDKLVNLVKALNTYGSYAQQYFNYKTDSASADNLLDISGMTEDDFSNYNYYCSEELPDDLTFSGYSLVLKSETSLRFYFICENIAAHSFSYYDNNTYSYIPLTPVSVGNNKYYVSFDNIYAMDLGESVGFSIDDNIYISASPMAYAHSVLKIYGESTIPEKINLCNTVKAMKLYYNAADEFFNN